MDRQTAPRSVDHRIADLATAQHGVVGRAQLRSLGLTPAAIDQRLRRGRLHSVHRGVYAVGHRVVSREGRWTAALLALGDRAVLSHRSAAAVWAIQRSETARVDVTLPSRSGRNRRPGIAVHRSSTLDASEVTRHGGLAVTTPARTLLDLAEVVTRRSLERAIDEAERLRIFDLDACRDSIATAAHRVGSARLAGALDAYDLGSNATRSELEERFLDICAAAGLPMPRVNLWIPMDDGGVEADCAWPAQRLIVELDGFQHHRGRARFERDRRRDRRLRVTGGWHTLRLTWRDLVDHRAEVVADLRELLDATSHRVAT